MIRRLIRADVGALVMLACATGCQRADPLGTAAGSAAQPAANAPGVASGVTPQGDERLVIARFLGEGCALDRANLAWCWSDPISHQNSREDGVVPKRVPELDGALAFLKSADFSYILRSGNLYIWGSEQHSYLGDVSKPTLMPAPTGVTNLAASGAFVAALQHDAEMWEWMDTATSEAAGEPEVMDNRRPWLLAKNVRSLAPPASDYFVGADGKIYERIFEGDDVPRPKQVTDLKDPLSVTVCGSLSCASMNPKHVECWEEKHASETFELKGPSDIVSLKCAGGGYVYALLANGEVWYFEISWGVRKFNRIPTLEGVSELGLCAGNLVCPHCVKSNDGSVSCWGEESRAQLGSGDWPRDPHFTPLLKGRDVTTPRSQ